MRARIAALVVMALLGERHGRQGDRLGLDRDCGEGAEAQDPGFSLATERFLCSAYSKTVERHCGGYARTARARGFVMTERDSRENASTQLAL